jgi:hypothetical protein
MFRQSLGTSYRTATTERAEWQPSTPILGKAHRPAEGPAGHGWIPGSRLRQAHRWFAEPTDRPRQHQRTQGLRAKGNWRFDHAASRVRAAAVGPVVVWRRPGTQPVALIVALGKAAELAARDHFKRTKRCQQIKERVLQAFYQLGGVVTGDQSKVLKVAKPRPDWPKDYVRNLDHHLYGVAKPE